MWTLAFGHREDRTPTHGYAATREAAMSVCEYPNLPRSPYRFLPPLLET
jgi:hypothetical protein